MQFKLKSIVMTVLVIFPAAGVYALTLAEKGRTEYQIVIPENASDTIKNSANELKSWLKKSTQADFPVVSEQNKGNKNIFLAGGTEKGNSLNLDGWKIQVRDNNIYLSGDSDRGTFYVVCDFLERYADIRWLTLDITSVPPKERITVPDTLDLNGIPAFPEYRLYYLYVSDTSQRNEEYFTLAAHNKGNWVMLSRYGTGKVYGSPAAGHTYLDYAKDFPEEICWMNNQGVRVKVLKTTGGQICYTNPEVRKRFIEKLRSYIASDREKGKPYPTLYDISQNDCGTPCFCPECKAEAEKYGVGGMVVNFTNAVADGIAVDYPEITIQMFAYKEAEKVSGVKCRPNVMVRVAGMDTEFNGAVKRDVMRPFDDPCNRGYSDLLKVWSGVSSKIAIWDYWKMYYEPFANPKGGILDRGEYLRSYHALGTKSIFIEAEISEEKPESFYDLRLYTALKLLDDPQKNITVLAKDFGKRVYGKAEAPMWEYLNLLETRMKEEKSPLAKSSPANRKYLDEAFFRKAYTLLDQAEKLAADQPQVLPLIQQERLVVDLCLLNMPKMRKKLSDFVSSETLLKRLWQEYEVYLNRYWQKEGNPARLQKIREKLEAALNRPPLPERFKNQSCIDLIWADIQAFSKIVGDADAVTGKAREVDPVYYAGKENFHARDFEFGIYSHQLKKGLLEGKIPKKEMFKDEKYHFYYMGRTALTESCVMWLHWTWAFGFKLDTVFDPQNSTMTYDVYVSLKFQGPSYVSGSQNPDAIRTDRIVFVRHLGKENALPSELAGKNAISYATGEFGYHIRKVADDDASDHTAVIPDGKEKDSPGYHSKAPTFGIIDFKTKNRPLDKSFKDYQQDEKYHLYLLGTAELPPDSFLWGHWTWDMSLSLGKKIKQPGKYEIYISMKVQGPAYVPGSTKANGMFVDNVFVVSTDASVRN